MKERQVFKFGAEARKTVLDDAPMCTYECEKSCTLKKHMNSKHTEQKCKVCSQDFKTIMDLVSHVAKEYHETEEE